MAAKITSGVINNANGLAIRFCWLMSVSREQLLEVTVGSGLKKLKTAPRHVVCQGNSDAPVSEAPPVCRVNASRLKN